MKFLPTKLPGVWIVDLEKHEDERGFFARSWCRREFEERGLNPNLVQCSVSFNHKKGTLRGMHYQIAPHEEARLVRCTRGAIYDVAVDLRPTSPTRKQWLAVELTADSGRALYIPEGFAHGFQTLSDNTEVFYQMSEFYFPELSRGILYCDPALAIPWPVANLILSRRDQAFSCFDQFASIINS
jgi:dTDP-4-dehydrorhamnose 3,5-epimerase